MGTSDVCAYPGCGRARLGDSDMCIFHAPAEKKGGPQKFRHAVAQEIQRWRNEKAEVWDFRGWVFTEVDWASVLGDRPEFEAKADFSRATFTQNADFFRATFAQDADFGWATFTQDANFWGATFTQEAHFGETGVHGWLQLRRLIFRQQSGYWPLKFSQIEFRGKGVLDLRDNDLQERNPVVIRECNLGRILLSNTDLKCITFHALQFEETSDVFLGGLRHARRLCIGDEWVRRTKVEHGVTYLPTWNDVDLTYQKLAKHFRDNFNHPVANDCERGFFEARRNAEKAKGRLRGWCNYCLISLYKYASYYSGLIWLPVLWLLAATLLVFPGLYDLTLLRRDLVFVPPARYWPSLDAMIASLRVAALDRAWLSRKMLGDGNAAAAIPQGDQFWVSVFAVVQLVATAALIALFILSLRRRFKHGD